MWARVGAGTWWLSRLEVKEHIVDARVNRLSDVREDGGVCHAKLSYLQRAVRAVRQQGCSEILLLTHDHPRRQMPESNVKQVRPTTTPNSQTMATTLVQ